MLKEYSEIMFSYLMGMLAKCN